MEKVSKAVASDVQASFRELAKTANQLNFVSDALGKYVVEVEDALKTLNLGVAGWVTVEQLPEIDGLATTHRELGYDKIGKHWCIGLRAYREAAWSPEWLDFEIWRFDEGPRWLRIKAVDYLPALIQELNRMAATVAKHTAEKLPAASDLASQISALVEDKDRGKTK